MLFIIPLPENFHNTFYQKAHFRINIFAFVTLSRGEKDKRSRKYVLLRQTIGYKKTHMKICGKGVAMKYLKCIALTIAIIGAINWGLIGLFNFDLVSFIFGSIPFISKIIYILVGICGIYLITFYGLLHGETE